MNTFNLIDRRVYPIPQNTHYFHYLHHSLASGQTTGREHSPTHQEKIGLKIYWTWVCPSEQETAAAAAKLLQSCLILWDPIDGSPPGSLVPGILQARILEWVAISFSNAWKWKVKENSLSRVQLVATTWTAAYQAPPSMGFSRQEYWSGLPLPSPRPLYPYRKPQASG